MKYFKIAIICIVLLQIIRGLFYENDEFTKLSDTKFEIKILTGSEGPFSYSHKNNTTPEILLTKIDEILKKRDFCNSDFEILNIKPKSKRLFGLERLATKEIEYLIVTGVCL